MNLRLQAEKDLSTMLESTTAGFGWETTLIDPNGSELVINGSSNDISFSIDPNTGETVSARTNTITYRLSTILAHEPFAGKVPTGVFDSTSRPWLVVVQDVNGAVGTFKIAKTMPDRTVGIVVCHLESWKR